MTIWPKLEQRTEGWFKARAGRITASRLDCILTPLGKESKAEKSEDYIYELCSSCIWFDEVTFEGNRYTDHGNEYEPAAREEFIKRTGFDVREVGFVTHDDCHVLGCSPDGLIYKDDKPIAGLEIKCPFGKNHVKYLINGELPSKYKQQVHGSMVVTGLDCWYFMSYCEGFKPLILKVERNEYTYAIGEAMISFANRYIKERVRIMPILERKIRKEVA